QAVGARLERGHEVVGVASPTVGHGPHETDRAAVERGDRGVAGEGGGGVPDGSGQLRSPCPVVALVGGERRELVRQRQPVGGRNGHLTPSSARATTRRNVFATNSPSPTSPLVDMAEHLSSTARSASRAATRSGQRSRNSSMLRSAAWAKRRSSSSTR